MELVAERSRATDSQVALCEAFAHALQLFQAGDLDRARIRFDALAHEFDADGPSRFFAALCRQTVSHVDGVVVMND
ncbi:MAG: hypothetical protein IT532_08490 [Burkholderiales bacterium]|nr:hypothetical protein [Burkholderiales bacterium]